MLAFFMKMDDLLTTSLSVKGSDLIKTNLPLRHAYLQTHLNLVTLKLLMQT